MDDDETTVGDQSHTESAFRRGVAHGVQAAMKVISGPNKTRDDAFDELATFAQVIDDWRSGRAEINGWTGEPWHWTKKSYKDYLDKFKGTW